MGIILFQRQGSFMKSSIFRMSWETVDCRRPVRKRHGSPRYLESQGDLVSRLVMGITWVTMWVIWVKI